MSILGRFANGILQGLIPMSVARQQAFFADSWLADVEADHDQWEPDELWAARHKVSAGGDSPSPARGTAPGSGLPPVLSLVQPAAADSGRPFGGGRHSKTDQAFQKLGAPALRKQPGAWTTGKEVPVSDQDSISARCYGMMQSQGRIKVELLNSTNTLSISVGSGDVHLFITVADWHKLCRSVNEVLFLSENPALRPALTHRIAFDDQAGTATAVSE